MVFTVLLLSAIGFILFVAVLLSFIALFKKKRNAKFYVVLSLVSSAFYSIYVSYRIIVGLGIMVEDDSVLSATENKIETTEDAVPTVTIDEVNYELIEIDALFSGFAFDKAYYTDYYLNETLVVKGLVDTLLPAHERRENSYCLILSDLGGTYYDPGFFFFELDAQQELEMLKRGEVVYVKATLTGFNYSGMLGVNLEFDHCTLHHDAPEELRETHRSDNEFDPQS